MKLTLLTIVSIVLATLGAVNARAQDCKILEPWLTQGHQALPEGATNSDRVTNSQKEYSLRVQTAESLEAVYKSGALSQANLSDCLGNLSDRQNFLETFYYTLFTSSVERLDSAKSNSVQALMKIFHAKYGQAVPVFRILGSFQEQDPTSLPAGVQRGTDSLYMNFAEIDPNDWLLIFVHETLHAVDDQIFVGVEGYADQTVPKRMVALSAGINSAASLSAADLSSLNQWLMFGLDRGLLAEYRAWSATFQIYQDGLREGLWNHRAWLDDIIAQKQSNELLEKFTYDYLNSHSADPSDGIFSNQIISSGLKDLRLRLRNAQAAPSLYGLAPILGN